MIDIYIYIDYIMYIYIYIYNVLYLYNVYAYGFKTVRAFCYFFDDCSLSWGCGGVGGVGWGINVMCRVRGTRSCLTSLA